MLSSREHVAMILSDELEAVSESKRRWVAPLHDRKRSGCYRCVRIHLELHGSCDATGRKAQRQD